MPAKSATPCGASGRDFQPRMNTVKFDLRTLHSTHSLPRMAKLTYQRKIVGYHGCDAAVAAAVLAGQRRLKASANSYDWLGKGVYFWEHGPQRAYEWAIEQSRLSGRKIQEPSVLGARIDLG